MPDMFLHDRNDFRQLLEITANAEQIDDPSLVEKDYWIMHCLYGLQQAGLKFELKGGTSLSKGYGLIHRFSEDIDVHIEPDEKWTGFKVYPGKNHDDLKHRQSRKQYFEWLTAHLAKNVSGLIGATRDEAFDDVPKFRNGGIRLLYKNQFPVVEVLKEGILLEVGFEPTTPNQPRDITSWAYEKASGVPSLAFVDNRALGVPCYEPKYTFVDKLHAIIRRYRLFKEGRDPRSFVRHYYDLYRLIDSDDVQNFIGTPEYEAYKKERFGRDDTNVSNNAALRLQDPQDRQLFEHEYERTAAIYYRDRPSLEEILVRLQKDLHRL